MNTAARIVYVNGQYLPETEARVSIFDRGFMFGDGIYEVTTVLDGRLVDFPGHCARLGRSMHELGMKRPCSDEALLDIHRELVARNEFVEGLVYLQVTRGAEDREFTWSDSLEPTIVAFTQVKNLVASPLAARGSRVITVPDLRWKRRDIKTVQLLYPSLAKMQAKAAGKDDAWMVEDGFVTEGTSNNAFIVTADGTLVTRQLSTALLHGITRATVLRHAAETGLTVEERPFSVDEAKAASEAFVTAATSFVTAVVEIDGSPIGAGKPGPTATRLREIYIEESRKSAI
jgi:D-alanine transaminase